MDARSERGKRLAAAMREAALDAVFLWNPTTIGYFADFWEHPHRRFATLGYRSNGDEAAILPALSATTAGESSLPSPLAWTDADDPLKLFADVAARWELRTGIIGVDGDMPSRMLMGMQSVLPAALFRNAEGVVASVQRTKDAAEQEALHGAGAIVDEIFREITPRLVPGRAESAIGEELRAMMRERGMEPAFAIVGSGPNSAKPHHAASDRKLANGEILLLDFGGSYRRYGADITRVVHLGAATEAVRNEYAAVFAAHYAAWEAIRPGVTGAQADAAARDLLIARGLGDLFVHRLGHGIGLGEHEPPYLVSTNHEPLQAGDAFTIEPGIYRAGEYGIRLENTYILAEEGPICVNEPISATLVELPV